MSERNIVRIDPIPKMPGIRHDEARKLRVAAYARVSTDHEDQQNSFDAQVDYYKKLIAEHLEWEFVRVYADEGISGCRTDGRVNFLQMIEDCDKGLIDLILTKSVSRFARNTVDSISTIRHLKSKGIGVWFEKENILSLDSKGEFVLTLMSSLAQEESRSISENVAWGQRKRFADGKSSLAYSRFLGYDQGPEKYQMVVNEEQAHVVRMIFRMFLQGHTPQTISNKLTAAGCLTPAGLETWNQTTVRRMLSNEKYKGDALLQKEFTVDFLQKKMKKNEGEVPQYYVEGNHEAIISPQVFDMVQAEMERRKRTQGSRYSGVSIFSNKIKCGDCGSWYGAKVWHSTDKYRKVVYRCNHKYNDEKCQTPHVTEEEIKAMFIRAYNELISEKTEIIANIKLIQKTLFDTTALIEERDSLQEEMAVLVEMTQAAIAENARVAQNQEEYQKRYNGLLERYETAKSRYDELVYDINQKQAYAERMRQFIKALKAQDRILTEFDDALWGCMVDYVTIGRDKKSITFKDGTEITVG